MWVYRISKTQYANDLQGTGSKLFGGRWNHIDTPCIYTSESRALAVLEYSANIGIDFIPRALSLCVFEIDETQIELAPIENLPGNWTETPAPKATKDFGTQWLRERKGILKIPSIIIPQECNYLLNPFSKKLGYELVETYDFVYDLRIKSI